MLTRKVASIRTILVIFTMVALVALFQVRAATAQDKPPTPPPRFDPVPSHVAPPAKPPTEPPKVDQVPSPTARAGEREINVGRSKKGLISPIVVELAPLRRERGVTVSIPEWAPLPSEETWKMMEERVRILRPGSTLIWPP